MLSISDWRNVVPFVALCLGGILWFTTGQASLRRMGEIEASGVDARAEIVTLGYFTAKGGKRHWSVTLQWTDQRRDMRSAGPIRISEGFAQTQREHNRVAIRYLPNAPDAEPVIVDDLPFAQSMARQSYQNGKITLGFYAFALLNLMAIFWVFSYLRRHRTE